MKRDHSWNHIIAIVPGSQWAFCCSHFLTLANASSHNVAPRASFEETFQRVYKAAEIGHSATHSAVHPQEIALIFIVLAQGTVFNIELPSYDESVEEWLYLSQQSLVKGNFMSDNMVVGLQTLVSLILRESAFTLTVTASYGTSLFVRGFRLLLIASRS